MQENENEELQFEEKPNSIFSSDFCKSGSNRSHESVDNKDAKSQDEEKKDDRDFNFEHKKISSTLSEQGPINY